MLLNNLRRLKSSSRIVWIRRLGNGQLSLDEAVKELALPIVESASSPKESSGNETSTEMEANRSGILPSPFLGAVSRKKDAITTSNHGTSTEDNVAVFVPSIASREIDGSES